MILRVGDHTRTGRAVACPLAVEPVALARAVRRDDLAEGEPPCEVRCRTPGPAHRYVGCVHPAMGLKVRTALASAGRARGMSTPYDDRIAALEARLAEFEDPPADARGEREAVARQSESTAALSERVAAQRGRLDARRAVDADVDEAAAGLEEAVAELADVETTAVAARQAHGRERRSRRRARDRLTRRLSVEDDLANARREARAWLVERLRPAYRTALAQIPGHSAPEDPFAAPPVPAALAVARVARPAAPIVVACDRFANADAAAAWLGGPVIRLRV